MQTEMPQRAATQVADSDGAIVSSWEQPIRWRSVPGAMYRALLFTVRSAPGTVAVALGVATVRAASYAVLYVLLQAAVSRLSAVTGVAQLFAGPGLTIVLAGCALLLLLILSTTLGDYLQWRLQSAVFVHTDMSTIRAATKVPLERFEDASFYALLQRCTNSVGQICAAAPRIVQILGDVVAVVAITATLSAGNSWVIPIALAASVPALISQFFSARRWYQVEARNAWPARLRYYLSHAVQRKDAAAEIRSFGLGNTFENWSRNAWDEMYLSMNRARKERAWSSLAASLSSGLVVLAGILVAVGSTAAGGGFSAIVAIVLGLVQLKSLFGQIFDRVSSVMDVSLYLGDVDELDKISVELAMLDRPDEAAGASPPLSSVELSNVGYRYPGASRPALSGVSLSIRSGELVAVVGRNGSGKTTLAKIVAGLLPAATGTVQWGDQDYSEVAERVTRGVTMQFQHPTRWSFTVGENVWLGDTSQEINSPRVMESLASAGAEGMVSSLDEGLDTRLGSELGPGSDLSGGQWQRLAVARCFFRDSELIILDEPTSSFDAAAEADFLRSVRELLRGRAGVLITHRFSSLKQVDSIYVLDSGRVAEHGTHDELVELNGIYADLYRQQVKNLLDLD